MPSRCCHCGPLPLVTYRGRHRTELPCALVHSSAFGIHCWSIWPFVMNSAMASFVSGVNLAVDFGYCAEVFMGQRDDLLGIA